MTPSSVKGAALPFCEDVAKRSSCVGGEARGDRGTIAYRPLADQPARDDDMFGEAVRLVLAQKLLKNLHKQQHKPY